MFRRPRTGFPSCDQSAVTGQVCDVQNGDLHGVRREHDREGFGILMHRSPMPSRRGLWQATFVWHLWRRKKRVHEFVPPQKGPSERCASVRQVGDLQRRSMLSVYLAFRCGESSVTNFERHFCPFFSYLAFCCGESAGTKLLEPEYKLKEPWLSPLFIPNRKRAEEGLKLS